MFQGFSLNESQLFVSSFRRILTSLANTGGHHQHFYHQTPILHFLLLAISAVILMQVLTWFPRPVHAAQPYCHVCVWCCQMWLSYRSIYGWKWSPSTHLSLPLCKISHGWNADEHVLVLHIWIHCTIFHKFEGPFQGWPKFFGVNFLISSILKNWLLEIEALGPNLYVSAIKALLRVVQGPHITMTKLVDFGCPQLYYLFMHHTSMHFQIFNPTQMEQQVHKTFASMQKQIPLYLQHSRWTMLHLQIFSCRKAHIHAHYGKYPQNLYRLMNINSFAFPAFQMHWYTSQNTVEPLLSYTSENP